MKKPQLTIEQIWFYPHIYTHNNVLFAYVSLPKDYNYARNKLCTTNVANYQPLNDH
jgi:hypothetical protein